MELVCGKDLELTLLSAFLAKVNKQSEHHIGYCGDEEGEILQTLEEDFAKGENFVVATKNGTIIAGLGFDMNTEGGQIEVWGPFVDDPNWEGVALSLWEQLVSRQPISGYVVHGFCNKENEKAQRFLLNRGAKKEGEHHVLEKNQEGVSFLAMNKKIAEPDAVDVKAFAALHDFEFPDTYYGSDEILKRCGEDRRLFVSAEEGEVTGYIYVEAQPAFKEGSIEYVAVAPHHRGKGVGRALLAYALRFLFEEKNIAATSITVSEKDVAAYRLYSSCGFSLKHKLVSYRIG
ncbi:GNAT family N-acetyltransferase [Shouchella shacheensis]|uniref:GNAT family N-acetyltransferase n=1 Tax=Shouchella shacheensis TaxID=1649580 RepID=UPI00073FEE43|nr:GNAT family N-acetyltransferase [Shouchella shacheensis]